MEKIAEVLEAKKKQGPNETKQGVPLRDFLDKSGLGVMIQNNFSQYIIPTCRFVKREKVHPSHAYETYFYEIDVTRDLCNSYGNLHGGASATIVDFLSSCTVFSVRGVGSVTIELSLSYPSAAKLGETITIESRVLKYGRSIVYSSTYIKVDDRLIIDGRHTKMLVGQFDPKDPKKKMAPLQSKM